MTRARWLLLPVALAALAALAWWLFPSNARRIRTRFQILATLVSVPAAEQDLARLARARRFGTMLAGEVEVTFDAAPPVSGRDAVIALVAMPPGVRGGVAVELDDITVQVASGGNHATSGARARVRFTDPSTNQPSIEEHDVALEWRKIDAEWLVATARVGSATTGR